MATASTTTAQEFIELRLDALDRALLGLLPRSERLAVVADVEAKIYRAHAAEPARIAEAAEVPDRPFEMVAATTRRRPTGRRRSRLALSSGVLGIVALALLLLLPVTHLVVGFLAEAIGEVAAIALLVMNFLVVALGGAGAVVLGITALVRLARRHGRQAGHGWAITGLCTGPLPALVGGLAMLMVGLPMLGEVVGQSRYYDAPPTYVSATIVSEPLTPAAPAIDWNAPAAIQSPSAPDCATCAPSVANASGYVDALLSNPPRD